MTSARQGDLFTPESQSDLFDEDAPTPVFRADPDEVRAELYKILAEARAAKTLPWEPRQLSLYRTIFPQMTNWLPEDEAAQLRFDFRNGDGPVERGLRLAGLALSGDRSGGRAASLIRAIPTLARLLPKGRGS